MTRIFVLVSLLFAANVNATVIYEVNGGKLTSILNVDVGGTFYDVSFQNGSFNTVYGSSANLTFTSGAQASAASTALLSLLVDNVQASDNNFYNFDTSNSLLNGCANYVYCDALTAYSVYTDLNGNERTGVSYARNFYDLNSDFVGGMSLSTDYNTSSWPWYTYAVWTEATVPESGSILLLALGLFGLGTLVKSRKKSA